MPGLISTGVRVAYQSSAEYLAPVSVIPGFPCVVLVDYVASFLALCSDLEPYSDTI
jgi:hypothetical protein